MPVQGNPGAVVARDGSRDSVALRARARGGLRRISWRGAGNQGACRPASSRCSRGRAIPARRAGPGSIRAGASRTNGGTCAGARARPGPAAAPSPRRAPARRAARAARRACPTNSAARRSRRAPRAPSASARCASTACRPTGTMRVLLPLPSTRTVRSRRSTSVEIEPDQLRQPQAGRIEQLHDRLVAHAELLVGAELSRRVI